MTDNLCDQAEPSDERGRMYYRVGQLKAIANGQDQTAGNAQLAYLLAIIIASGFSLVVRAIERSDRP